MKKPLIGILVYKPGPLQDYEMAKRLNVDLLVFRSSGINWKKKKIKGFLFRNGKWTRQTCPFPAAVYKRSYSSSRRLTEKLENAIGRGKVFNCITRFDKWEIYNILQSSPVRLHVPLTHLCLPHNFIPLLMQHQKLILKPSKGQLGRQVYLIERTDHNEYRLYANLYPQNNAAAHEGDEDTNNGALNANSHLLKNIAAQTPAAQHALQQIQTLMNDGRSFAAKINTTNIHDFVHQVFALIGHQPFLIQQFIPLDHIDQKIYDLRMYVQKDRRGKWTTSGGFSRVGDPNSYINNLCTEIKSFRDILLNPNTLLSVQQLKNMKRISLQAAQAIESKLGHLGEMGVDFGIDQLGNPWIIEVNGRTQKQFVKRVHNAQLTRNVYLKPIKYARFLAGDSCKQPA